MIRLLVHPTENKRNVNPIYHLLFYISPKPYSSFYVCHLLVRSSTSEMFTKVGSELVEYDPTTAT